MTVAPNGGGHDGCSEDSTHPMQRTDVSGHTADPVSQSPTPAHTATKSGPTVSLTRAAWAHKDHGAEDGSSVPNSGSRSEECVWEVKRILDRRMSRDGRYEYKVRWENTWEAEENLDNCPEAIEFYMQHRQRLQVRSASGIRKKTAAKRSQVRIKISTEMPMDVNLRIAYSYTMPSNRAQLD